MPVGNQGPRCQCGKPLTPADAESCGRCEGLARSVGRRRLPDESWPAAENIEPRREGRCQALLSATGRIIRLEAPTGSPFDERDVDAAVEGIRFARLARRNPPIAPKEAA